MTESGLKSIEVGTGGQTRRIAVRTRDGAAPCRSRTAIRRTALPVPTSMVFRPVAVMSSCFPIFGKKPRESWLF